MKLDLVDPRGWRPVDALQVTEALRRVKGVATTTVDFRTGRSQVAYNPNQTSPEQMIAAVASAAYPARR